jgi:hypothetical protein
MKNSYFARAALGTWVLGAACAGLVGCDVSTDGLLDDLENTEICDGMTLEELMNAVTISESCKAELQAYLPQPQDNFENRLIAVGQSENDDGSLSVYLQGVDSSGNAFGEADWNDLEVRVTVDASEELLAQDAFSVTAAGDLTGEILSISFVNDYSGSMSNADLEVTSEIESDILGVLPDIFEGEVTLFSTEVSKKQAFTEDRQILLDAVAYDATFMRDLTALYDGMGAGLSSLVERERPVRLLVVATDGQENSSTEFAKNQLASTIADENVCVLILGSLFSDPAELADFSRGCGAYFYTPGYRDLKSAVSEYVESLGNMIEVNIPAASRGDGDVEFSLGALSTTSR